MRYLFYVAQNYSLAIARPLQEAIWRRGGEVCWFISGNSVNREFFHSNECIIDSVEEVKAWNPDVVFVPGNVVPAFIPGIKVGIFHGFSAGKINRRGRPDHFEIRHCFDLYCTQGPETTLPFQEQSQKLGTFSVAETGWPTLDPMFSAAGENPYIAANDDRKTVLLCSTFSRHLSCAPHIYEQVKQMAESGRWRWLVQFHPKMDRKVVEMYKGLNSDNLQFVETDNVLPLLQAADVMLCDTSSVLIMFLLQQKPVVTFRNSTGRPHLLNVEQVEQIEPALQQALERPPELMEKIAAYSNEIHPYRDGCSSERVLDAVDGFIKDELAGLKRKPLNLIRQLKMRKKLNYWRLF